MPNPRRKVKKFFLQTLLFISIIALLGHIAVNIWERFVMKNELGKIKTSLNSLKVTITHIGSAYNSLHEELQTLADIAEKGAKPAYDKNVYSPDNDFSTARLIHDVQIQDQCDLSKHEKKTSKIKEILNYLNTSNSYFTFPHLSETEKDEKFTDKKHMKIQCKDSLCKNEAVQYNLNDLLMSTEIEKKRSIGIATRNSLKNTSVGSRFGYMDVPNTNKDWKEKPSPEKIVHECRNVQCNENRRYKNDYTKY